VLSVLDASGFNLKRQQLAVSTNGHRFFATLDLEAELAPGVLISVGVRNSTDKSFPIGFCAGSRVLVCENLAFSAELLVRRKHTRFGERHFTHDIAHAMPKLSSFRDVEAKRIEVMTTTELTDVEAESLLLRAYDKGIIPVQLLSRAIKEWRHPSYDDFKPRTAWSLFNACTTVLAEKAKVNPMAHSLTTMRLTSLVAPTVPALVA
jgi:hypothetical protein